MTKPKRYKRFSSEFNAFALFAERASNPRNIGDCRKRAAFVCKSDNPA